MSQPVLTLELPKDVYEYVCRAAKGMNQPLEEALVNIVKAATPSLEKVPLEYHPELEALEDLGDDELWNVAKSALVPAQQRRLEMLLDKNQRDQLTEKDSKALVGLRVAADLLMLRRSYAYLLLKYRGHHIPNLANLRQ